MYQRISGNSGSSGASVGGANGDLLADTVTGTGAAGASATAARVDHRHPMVAHDHSDSNHGGTLPFSTVGGANGNLVADTVTGTGVAGVSGTAARLDHQHPLVAHDHSDANHGGAISPAGLPDIRPLGWILNNLKACNYPDPGLASSGASTAASTHYVFKCYTPQAITLTDVLMWIGTAGATCAGFYAAAFDSTGTLFAGTASADRGTQFHASTAMAVLPLGTPVAVTPGFFYISLKTGTAGTQPQPYRGASNINNMNLSTGTASASAPRHGTAANDWTGGTPPGTLGSITALATPAFLVAAR